MDPKFKALIAAFISIPFALALIGVMQNFGLFPFMSPSGWNDFKLIIGIVVGVSYFVALAIFSPKKRDDDSHDRK